MRRREAALKAERLRKKEAEKLAALAGTAPPNAEPPNPACEEFVSRLYCAKRTYLVRVPRSAVEALNLQPGELVRLKILQGEL